MFIPHVVHEAIGVLAAVSVATACIIPNTVTDGITQFAPTNITPQNLSIEHPSGEFTVSLDFERHEDEVTIKKIGGYSNGKVIEQRRGIYSRIIIKLGK